MKPTVDILVERKQQQKSKRDIRKMFGGKTSALNRNFETKTLMQPFSHDHFGVLLQYSITISVG